MSREHFGKWNYLKPAGQQDSSLSLTPQLPILPIDLLQRWRFVGHPCIFRILWMRCTIELMGQSSTNCPLAWHPKWMNLPHAGDAVLLQCVVGVARTFSQGILDGKACLYFLGHGWEWLNHDWFTEMVVIYLWFMGFWMILIYLLGSWLAFEPLNATADASPVWECAKVKTATRCPFWWRALPKRSWARNSWSCQIKWQWLNGLGYQMTQRNGHV